MTLVDLTMRVSMNASEFWGWVALAAVVGFIAGACTLARILDGRQRP